MTLCKTNRNNHIVIIGREKNNKNKKSIVERTSKYCRANTMLVFRESIFRICIWHCSLRLHRTHNITHSSRALSLSFFQLCTRTYTHRQPHTQTQIKIWKRKLRHIFLTSSEIECYGMENHMHIHIAGINKAKEKPLKR